MLVCACGFVSTFNSKAFQLAGMDDNTPVPERALIEQKCVVLTGLVATKIPMWPATPSTAELIEPIEAGGKMLPSYGVTSVTDAVTACVASVEEICAYNLVKLRRRLPVRMAGAAWRSGIVD